MHKVDNLIVGGGLAGIWFAFQCAKRNVPFALITKAGHSKSSEVAAGIFNPILANRQKLSYKADEIYPDLGKKYHELEALIHQKIFHKYPVAYIIESLKELNDWAALSESHIFKDYVLMKNERIADHVISDFGVLEISSSGWVDIPLMIHSFISRIVSPNVFLEDDFIPDLLVNNEEGYFYQNINAQNVVFCQGTAATQNPFTANVQLKPAKGEVLYIQNDETIENLIPQNGVFMLPLGNNCFKIGSNFEWNDMTWEPTQKAQNEIIGKFTRWYKGPFEIVTQIAGVRPSSNDRRPFVGKLNTLPNAYILNGLGSKGVALAPYYSEMLYKHIYENGEIEKDVEVYRFKSK